MRDSIECFVLSTELHARSVGLEKREVAIPSLLFKADKKEKERKTGDYKSPGGVFKFTAFDLMRRRKSNLTNRGGHK
jgi:hypothetical protein